MYEEFFKLESRPFLTVPDPTFLYWTEAHSLAFAMLRYGLMTRAPITVITGEIGAGKTTLLRQLLREIPADLVVSLVSNMQAGRGQLLQWIMMNLDHTSQKLEYIDLFKRFQDYVIDCYSENKRVVVIIDEAQNLSIEQLEELRMLSNINADQDELLQVILVGQPQLRSLLNDPKLVQFSQRITSDFHLTVMSETDVEKYILHRLDVAKAQWRIFPNATCKLIYRATQGVPRLVNILCDLALVYGYSTEQHVIAEPLLREFLSHAQSRGIYQQFQPLNDTPTLIHQAR